MTTDSLFNLVFLLVVPFWALMIFAPKWSVTRRVAESPLIVLPPLVIFTVLALPMLPAVWDPVWSPTVDKFAAIAGPPEGAAMMWAQVLAWDLFVGRWMYLESRRLEIHPLLMAPIMVFTILLSPFGLPLFLVVRKVCDTTNRGTTVVTHQ